MEKYQSIAVINTPAFAILPSATISVYRTGTTTLASLYANKAGTTVLGNPLSADAYGNFYFYAANGRYDITIAQGTNSRTISDISLFDPDDFIATVDDASFYYLDGSREVEADQPGVHILDTGIDAIAIRLRSAYGVGTLQVNINTTEDPVWVDIIQIKVDSFGQPEVTIKGLYEKIFKWVDQRP